MRQRRRDERFVEHVVRGRRSPLRRRRTTIRRPPRPSASASPAAAKSPAVHLIDFTPCAVTTLPSVRASAPAGNKLASGSMTYGSGSYSTLMRSMASCASSSLRAATARIRSPTNSGSLVSIGSAGRRRWRHVVGRQHRNDAVHRERLARVDLDARVRHRAREQTAKQHAVGAKVLGVFGAPVTLACRSGGVKS